MQKRLHLVLVVVLAGMISCALDAPVVRSQVRGKGGQRSLATRGVPASRLARLRRGINLSHWFAQSPRRDYSATHLKSHTTANDIGVIKSLGFDHVRFTIEPAPLIIGSDPARLNSGYLGHIDAALDMLLASGLSVVVDIHPSDQFKIKLRTDDQAAADFAAFWHAFARHLSTRDPERIFLEILNEPMVEDAYRWIGIQSRVAAAIREAAPRHTIIATGPRWSAVDQLLLIEPLADSNVIYTFHFYEPHNFTHQGASWGAQVWPHLKGVPYPSNPEVVSGLLAALENREARDTLKHYGEERWNASRIEREIALASGWARKRNVALICNEFGVYRAFAPETARLKWIEDVRIILEKHGIGWAMWDYAGSFGVVNKKKDRDVTPDLRTLAALGMQPRKAAQSR